MANLLARRREMLGSRKGILMHWLCADDAPVNGHWASRGKVKYSFAVSPSAISSYDSVNKLYVLGGNDSNYVNLNVNYVMPSTGTGFSMGHHWRCEFDIYLKKQGATTFNFFDIASVGAVSTKALGIGFGTTLSSGTSSSFLLNWKMQGNNSNPFPADTTHPAWDDLPADEYAHVVGVYSLVDGGDGYDRLIATVNGITVEYDTKIPQADYTAPWDYNLLYIGRGRTSGYYNNIKVKDIKIYVID